MNTPLTPRTIRLRNSRLSSLAAIIFVGAVLAVGGALTARAHAAPSNGFLASQVTTHYSVVSNGQSPGEDNGGGNNGDNGNHGNGGGDGDHHSPSPSISPSETASPTPTETVSPTPTETATATATVATSPTSSVQAASTTPAPTSVVQAATTPSTGSNLGTPFLFAGLLMSLGAYIMRLRRKL